MASLRLCLPLLLVLQFVLSVDHRVLSDDVKKTLLQDINAYRASLNLSTLTINKNAGCFASEMVDQFKNQPCTNSTGSNTVPGTEAQLGNYPNLLKKCHLNVSDTRDGAIMPACVPNLDRSLVLSNFTQSQYSQSVNSSQFTGAGIDSKNDWIVVVLTTNTSGGSFAPESSAADTVFKVGMICNLLFLVMALFL